MWEPALVFKLYVKTTLVILVLWRWREAIPGAHWSASLAYLTIPGQWETQSHKARWMMPKKDTHVWPLDSTVQVNVCPCKDTYPHKKKNEILLLFPLLNISFLFVYFGCLCMYGHACGGQRTTYGSWFSPSAFWVLGLGSGDQVGSRGLSLLSSPCLFPVLAQTQRYFSCLMKGV